MSTLTYAGDSYLLAAGTRRALELASDQLVREGHPPIRVVDGDREYAKQVRIFLDRYVPVGSVNGRRVYDYVWWNGVNYARISPAGRVAPPSLTAPHVARRGADLGYPYNNRYTKAHARLVEICPVYELDWTGRHFAEDWHFERRGPLGVIGAPASGGGEVPFTPPPVTKVEEEADLMATNAPIWNKVPKVGDKPDVGTLWYGNEAGDVVQLVKYSRGLVSVAFFGAVPDKDGNIPDLIPTVAEQGGDWDKVVALHRAMKKR